MICEINKNQILILKLKKYLKYNLKIIIFYTIMYFTRKLIFSIIKN